MWKIRGFLQKILFQHFNSEGDNGFLLDVSVTLIDITGGTNPIKQEHYCQHTLMTLAPHGHNVEDDFWIAIYLYSYLLVT